jgi:hypothetical protein
MLIFCIQLCFAEDEESYEEINSYFNSEPEQTTILEGHLEYNLNENQEENTIELNKHAEQCLNLLTPQRISSKSFSKKPTFHPIQDELKSASMFSTQEYNIKPVSTSYSKEFGKFSFGTMYDSGLNKASRNDSTALFAKYEGKYAALSMGFSKSSNYNKDSFDDEFFVAPEIKLTKRLSLLDVLETDVNQINKSNEFVLRYTPHFKKYADDVQFELGAGQSFYEDNFIKSSVRFTTKFKL